MFSCISLRELFMSSLKSSISNMRWDFKSSSRLSDVMEYAGCAFVGELGSDGAVLPWFLLAMILPLPLANSLYLVLAVLSVPIFSVLQACVSVILGFNFSSRPWKQLGLQEVWGVAKLARVECHAGCYFSNVLPPPDLECTADAGSKLPCFYQFEWPTGASSHITCSCPFSREYQEVGSFPSQMWCRSTTSDGTGQWQWRREA